MRDGQPFAFAGLWARWQGQEGEQINSYTILTTEPNDLVRSIHDRMPVILAQHDYEVWLDPKIQDVEQLRPLLRPSPSEDLIADPVETLVNNPAFDDPRCIKPLL